MQERDIRALIERVRQGQLPRRGFIRQLGALGLTAPMASLLLMHEGIAQTAAPIPYKPTQRGGGGTLKLIAWQAPVHLNPHNASGAKEREACRICYEPLAAFDADGHLVPMLAAEIPSRQNGGLSADGMSVTWKLKRGVTWHDGEAFSADDVVFNAAYARDPAAQATTKHVFDSIQVEKIDAHTVRVRYPQPTAYWAEVFVGAFGLIVPKHVFEPFMGTKARQNPAFLKPVGTGPYRVVDFQPGDALRAVAHARYHVPNQPFFDALELKGGGDATSAARTVLQTGEFDLATNLQVEDDVLKRLDGMGKGRAWYQASGDVQFISLNASDPWTEVDGERSSARSRHPAFSDKAVRTAFSLLVDRKGMQEVVYGRGALATANYVNSPPRFRSPNTRYEFNIDKANQVLEAAGWRKGADGIRVKGQARLKFVFQTATNGPLQKCQVIIKDACTKAGIELELKSVVASVFFGGDAANPDTFQKFWADVQMFTATMFQADPSAHIGRYHSRNIPQKANQWAPANHLRWSNAEFDALHDTQKIEMDPVKRAAMLIRMNDLLVGDGFVIPMFTRPKVNGVANKLVPVFSPWDTSTWALGYWYREA